MRASATSVVIAMIATMVVLASPALGQSGATPEISPETEGVRYVRENTWVTIAGTAGSATSIASAALVGVDDSGATFEQAITALNDDPGDPNRSYVLVDGDSFDGRARLGTCFTSGCNGTSPPRYVRLRITLQGGEIVTSAAPGLVVDGERPRILRYDITSPTRIVVVFSEPVMLPDEGLLSRGDSVIDWEITGPDVTVQGVATQANDCPAGVTYDPQVTDGCTRVLTTSTIPEDATPIVRYNPPPGPGGTTPVYEDFGGLLVRREDGSGATQEARDRVIPARPSVPQIAGISTASQPVAASDATPVLSLGNLNPDAAGQTLSVYVDGQPRMTGIAITGTTQQVEVTPSLGADRNGIEFAVVAVDAAGNRSDDTDKGSPPRAHGSPPPPILYDLDTTPPRPSLVRQVSGTELEVVLTEVVTPDGGAGQFSLGADGPQPTSVTGSGITRTLTFADQIDPDAGLFWEAAGTTYVDRVDLELVWDADGEPIIDVPLPPGPVFTQPANRIVTAATELAVAGTVPGGGNLPLVVDIHLDDPDATAASRVAADRPVTGGQWTATVPLPAGDDLVRSLFLHARSRHTQDQTRSPLPAAQSVEIVVDRADPEVEITAPSSSILGGGPDPVGPGEEVEVEWDATDDNPDAFSLTLTDSAGTVVDCNVPVFADEDGYSGSCTVPEGLASGAASLELTAVDLAGNSAADTFDDLEIDLTRFGAVGALEPNAPGGATITLDYGRPLQGTTSGFDWTANNGTRDAAQSRSPFSATIDGAEGVVTLGFPTPFPGPLTTAHPNARPSYTYDPPLLLGGAITDADGNEPATSGRVRDVIEPALDGVPASLGRLNGLTRRATIAECTAADPLAQTPPCPATGPVVQVTGTTDTVFEYGENTPTVNTVRVYAGAVDFTDPAQAAAAVAVADADVADDGSFRAIVGLAANRTQTFTLRAIDIHGSQGQDPVSTTVTVTEDSLGPDVRSLSAALVDADSVQVTARFDDDDAASVALAYQVGNATPVDLASPAVGADGVATFRWDAPDDVDLVAGGVRILATGSDDLGNVGQQAVTGIGNAPVLRSAVALDADTVRVTTSEPVATDATDQAGFAIQGGPGVEATSVDGQGRILLALADELPALTDLRVTYNGAGGWAAPDGRPLAPGSVPLAFGSLLPVTGLAAGPTGTDDVVLSYIDERNPPELVTGYEISRDGTVLATVPADTRIHVDTTAPTTGTITYTVVVVGTGGVRSAPASVTYTPGTGGPVDPGDGGGTGAPGDSTVVEACPLPAEPNITRQGGTVLSCDGRVAAIVPAGVADGDLLGAFVRRTGAGRVGYQTLTDLYQLVVITPDGATVDDFDGFVELSVRDLHDELADGGVELVTTLRVADDRTDEQAPRVGSESVASQLVTVGTFRTVRTGGQTLRVYGPDPAITPDRFATAAALSQTQFAGASRVVLARADDYPDALAAAPLAGLFGGPILLTRTGDVPITTLYELHRLGARSVVLVGGTAAISAAVEAQLSAAGHSVGRIGGATRFETATMVARTVGSVDGGAFLATGQDFADALAASAPAAALGRPVLLTPSDSLVDGTAALVPALGLDEVHIVGGEAALSAGVEQAVGALGVDVRRSGGPSRTETAIELADDLVGRGLLRAVRPLLASGDGDGRTSPDALAAGPIGGRERAPLLLTPRGTLPGSLATHLAGLDALRGILMAGGPAAITDGVRDALDEAR